MEEVENQPGQAETLAAPLGGDEETEVSQEEEAEVGLDAEREAVPGEVGEEEEDVV